MRILESVISLVALCTSGHATRSRPSEYPSLMWSTSDCIETPPAGASQEEILRSFFQACWREPKYVMHLEKMTTLDFLKKSGAFEASPPDPRRHPLVAIKDQLSVAKSWNLATTSATPLAASDQLAVLLDMDPELEISVFTDCPDAYRAESPRVRRFPLAEVSARDPRGPAAAMVDLACGSQPLALVPELQSAGAAFLLTPTGDGSARRMKSASPPPAATGVPSGTDGVTTGAAVPPPVLVEEGPVVDQLATTPFTFSALLTLGLTSSLLFIGFRCMAQISTPTRYEEKSLILNKEY